MVRRYLSVLLAGAIVLGVAGQGVMAPSATSGESPTPIAEACTGVIEADRCRGGGYTNLNIAL